MTNRTATALAAAVLVATGLTACGGDDDPAEAAADYCTAVEELRTEVAAFAEAVASDATVGDVQEQRESVTEAYEEAADAAEGRDETVRDAAEAAQDDFADAVGDIDDDTVLSEAVAEYEQAAAAYESELAAIVSDAGC